MKAKSIIYIPLCIAVLTTLFSVSLAMAATPIKVTLSGGEMKRDVAITNPDDLDVLLGTLCSDEPADNLTGRPSLTFAVQWTDNPNELTWHGHFYPAVGGQPAAVDIPDWQLYTSSDRILHCNSRVVGAEATIVLSKYEVPTQATSARPFQSAFSRLAIPAGLVLIVVLLALGLMAYRIKIGKRTLS